MDERTRELKQGMDKVMQLQRQRAARLDALRADAQRRLVRELRWKLVAAGVILGVIFGGIHVFFQWWLLR